MTESVLDKNREIYDHADDKIWRCAVYEPVHEGWHFANIGGRKFLDSIGMQAGLEPTSETLDLCCGSGAADFYLAQRFGTSVTGLDLNKRQIERARQRAEGDGRLQFIEADACAWSPSRHFDLVFSLDSLTLIADLPALFETCRKALRSGRLLAVADVVAEPSLTSEMRSFALREDGAISLLTAEELAGNIEAAGFTDVEITPLRDEAERVFTLIHGSVLNSADWQGVAASKIEEWKILSERYLQAFRSSELGYAKISAIAP